MVDRPRDEFAPLAAEFFVRDVAASIPFYRDRLGFEVVEERPDFAVVALGGAFLLLAQDTLYIPAGGMTGSDRGLGMDVRIMVAEVDVVYDQVRTAGVAIVHEIGDRDYGLRDFIIRDLDGFRLRFAAPLPHHAG